MHRFLQHDQLIHASKLLLAPIILLMLFVGLQNKGYDPTNHLSRNPVNGGLSFKHNSIAFTEQGFELPRNEKGFVIELIFEPEYRPYPSFEILLQIFGNSPRNQLLIGQWDRSLVVMNGDDYSNKRRVPKLYVPLGEAAGRLTVRITSGPEETAVYINNVLAGKSTSFSLQPPPGTKNRLLLGNNITVRNPWYGTLYDLSFLAAGGEGGDLHYSFTAPVANSIREEKERGPEILLPAEIPILLKRILLWPNFQAVSRPLMIFDITINILGFIPLGALLPIYLQSSFLLKKKPAMALSLFLVIALSLFIEISQIWIPSRFSSLLDLVLNSSGGLVGILISRRLFNRPPAN